MIYNDPGYLLYFNQLLVQVHQRFCPRDEAVKVVKQAEIIVKVVKGKKGMGINKNEICKHIYLAVGEQQLHCALCK